MGGLPVTAKYVIKARMTVSGVVEKHDIIGAIFGHSEGLLGRELDLRELQKVGRIGRIEVSTREQDGKLIAEIEIPSNLDMAETAIIAATIESIDKVGPYNAVTEIVDIEDVRAEKRRKIIERAVELYKKLASTVPESKELVEELLERVRTAEVIEWGEERLPAGPEVDTSDTLIIVEGRADVLNLLKHGYRNVIAIGGATVPASLKELCKKKKEVILFVDGDRGGELIARNALNVLDIDFIARAPSGREVEELTGKEIARALQNKVPAKEFLESLERERRQTKEVKAEVVIPPSKLIKAAKNNPPVAKEVFVPQEVVNAIEQLKGTLEAVMYDSEWREIARVPVKEVVDKLKDLDGVAHIVLDGIITQRLVDTAFSKGVKTLIGVRVGEIIRKPEDLTIATFQLVRPLQNESSEQQQSSS
ncbi:DNA primase DnaG [Infirmifilum sp. NZ]|uniref:DNA primase DnaG n=1 Tax=Infirmifilum sp. NZ TaxID=2926850 RepID=UPI00279A298A|nr:DNA primase DnaG [Infirmifilum sp. NZ]UNQ72505.1 DNA primase DnaG [Infirmifilum sp. NZ]